MNTLFFIDQTQANVSGYDRAYFSCHRDWTLVKILISNGASSTAEDLARQVLIVALKFKFSDLILNCSRILRKIAADAGNRALFEEYDGNIKAFDDIFTAEMRSEELYQRVLMAYWLPAEELSKAQDELQGYCDALVGLSEKYDSPVVFYNMFLVWTYHYELMQDYGNMLLICTQAEQYIEQNPNYLQAEKLATFQLKKMTAHLHLQDFKNGKITAERSLQLFEEGSDTWFSFMEYYLLTALHTENFIHGAAVFIRAKSNGKFKKLEAETKEKWRVYEVYLNYFIEKQPGQFDALKEQMAKSFRVSRFLSDDLLFQKESKMLGIHLLIGQVLFHLDRSSYAEAAEGIDRLRSLGKTLNDAENYRMMRFIKLMQQVLKANFKLADLSSTERAYENLVSHPFSYRGKLNELEVLPFEKLWNHVLARL
jgi:hypothetical protein